MTIELAGEGIAGVLGGTVAFLLQKALDYRLRARLSRVEAELRTQSQWRTAQLAKATERRARSLSLLHTSLDQALDLGELYIQSCEAGNSTAHVEELRRVAIRSWVDFNRKFASAEIFLSTSLAERIRNYGHVIADTRVRFELRQRRVEPGAGIKERLAPIAEALVSLSKLRSDVRPKLVNEIRAAMGAAALETAAQAS